MFHSETTGLLKNALDTFLPRLQRTAPGYAPSTALELMEWVKERVCIISVEWDELLCWPKRDSGEPGNLSDHNRLCHPIPGAHYHVITAADRCRDFATFWKYQSISILKVFTETKQRAVENLLTRSQGKKRNSHMAPLNRI